MRIDGYLEALREDVARIAAVGDESTVRAAELIALALESSLARRFQEALTEAALELSTQLEHGRVEVRIAGGDPELVYLGDPDRSAAVEAEQALDARLTLRLPTSLKARLDATAAAGGVSVNTWVVQALGRALESRPATGGGRRRLTGYGHS